MVITSLRNHIQITERHVHHSVTVIIFVTEPHSNSLPNDTFVLIPHSITESHSNSLPNVVRYDTTFYNRITLSNSLPNDTFVTEPHSVTVITFATERRDTL